MPHRQIVRNITSGQLSPVYVLHGEEPFFISEIVKTLLGTVVDEGLKDFNETVLYGRDTDVDEVLAAARRFPMMSDRQLVMVKEAQDMRMWKRKDDMAKLEAYASEPVPTTVLVFAHPHKKVDSRLKAVKTMSRLGTLFLSDKVRDYKLSQWISGHASARRCRLGCQSPVYGAGGVGRIIETQRIFLRFDRISPIIIFILVISRFGIRYINRKSNTEDLSDLLFILRRRNKRDI